MGAPLAGAIIALAMAAFILPPATGLAQPAQAQPQPLSNAQRYLPLALADSLASVAVDGERTAVALNNAVDEIKALQERVAKLEKRLAELDAKK
jgi:ubiquinone biosynthesis protein UbiJ